MMGSLWTRWEFEESVHCSPSDPPPRCCRHWPHPIDHIVKNAYLVKISSNIEVYVAPTTTFISKVKSSSLMQVISVRRCYPLQNSTRHFKIFEVLP